MHVRLCVAASITAGTLGFVPAVVAVCEYFAPLPTAKRLVVNSTGKRTHSDRWMQFAQVNANLYYRINIFMRRCKAICVEYTYIIVPMMTLVISSFHPSVILKESIHVRTLHIVNRHRHVSLSNCRRVQ